MSALFLFFMKLCRMWRPRGGGATSLASPAISPGDGATDKNNPSESLELQTLFLVPLLQEKKKLGSFAFIVTPVRWAETIILN